jgi:RNA polymerase sigma-70 factor (sigma-E family)
VELAVSPRPEDDTIEVKVDAPTFDDSFPALYRHAYRVAYRLCGSDSDAKDLAQDALVRAFGRWETVRAYADPSAWVARVVTNLAFDQWRRRRLFRRLPVASREQSVPDDHVDLYLALDSLPRRQRQVVVLRYLADQSEAATAEALGCSVGTVKQHASRGLKSLRTRLDIPSLPEELP